MNAKLKQHLIENFGLDAEADDKTAKALLSEKLKSGELDSDTYESLLKDAKPADKAAELADTIAEKTAGAVAGALSPALQQIADALKSKTAAPKEETVEKAPEAHDFAKELADMEARLAKKFQGQTGPESDDMLKMAEETQGKTDVDVRVKAAVDRYQHTPTALCYKSPQAKLLGLSGRPMQYNGKEVNQPTERSTKLSAVWLKLQLFPELLSDHEKDLVKWALAHEKFHVPNNRGDAQSRPLSKDEQERVWHYNLNFYSRHAKALIDDTTSGGENSIPEFFDMDLITTPTLADENIPAFCNVVPVPRGTDAQNFIIGRPTVAAANTEGSAVGLFSTASFITNHDTPFFRAAGFIELGRNYLEDAHPRIAAEVADQYRQSVALWLNEQIMVGDGTTEPQGVTVDTGTADITPSNPTTGDLTLNDAFRLLFGVGKAHRNRGGRQNAIYVMTDTTYQRFRQIATGVTGDTRLVFGEDVESYSLFGHPVLIEEAGLTNSDVVFFQAKGYRLYQRQGARFMREDRGDTLVRQHSVILGVDVRYGGQLDEGSYCAVIDSAPA